MYSYNNIIIIILYVARLPLIDICCSLYSIPMKSNSRWPGYGHCKHQFWQRKLNENGTMCTSLNIYNSYFVHFLGSAHHAYTVRRWVTCAIYDKKSHASSQVWCMHVRAKHCTQIVDRLYADSYVSTKDWNLSTLPEITISMDCFYYCYCLIALAACAAAGLLTRAF